jgi:hypothetical protein
VAVGGAAGFIPCRIEVKNAFCRRDIKCFAFVYLSEGNLSQ